MAIIRLIALILSLAFFLFSCSAAKNNSLSYQEKPFRAVITWQIDSLSLAAKLTSSPESDSATLEFTSPSSLEGVILKKEGEKITLTLNELEISEAHLSRLAEITDFFKIDASIKKSSVTTISGTKLNCLQMLDANGEIFTVYLYPSSEIPRRITGKLYSQTVTLDVVSFEFIPK